MFKTLDLPTAATALPGRSHAWGNDPYNAHGFGWLGQLAFNTNRAVAVLMDQRVVGVKEFK